MKNIILILLISTLSVPIFSQDTSTKSNLKDSVMENKSSFNADDLFYLLNNEDEKEEVLVSAIFKGTKIINLQSVELTNEQELQFIISHRFGTINSGIMDLYGLDYGSIRMSFDYGIKDWINIGVARSSYGKIIDGSIKYELLHQGKILNLGKLTSSPVSIVGYSAIYIDPVDWRDPNRLNFSTSRLSYVNQLHIARKFNKNLSIQLSPTLLHYNMVPKIGEENDLFALGIGSRYKINGSVSLNLEYIPVFQRSFPDTLGILKKRNSLSIGVDIQTGGHVFQLMLTNSIGMYDESFVGGNTGTWKNGDIHFGFNITRPFSFKNSH
ncbi:MAG TPA: DUF5777 family beta-barrel protein [Flavobacteriales bacterium]|nr:DUF5777 family beta-barrel protein [Flavobacteriales bacterium]